MLARPDDPARSGTAASAGRPGAAQSVRLEAVIPDHHAGRRLDHSLALLFPAFSRSRLQQWLRQGRLMLADGEEPRPSLRVRGGERVLLWPPAEHSTACEPEAIPLSVVYEDEALLVIDKPAGLVVHPAAGHWAGTLQNALLHHVPALVSLPRGGIVHRLDKDTSGLLVVAKTDAAHRSLIEQMKARGVEREYRAIVAGVVACSGRIDAPIGRHPLDRKRMAVVPRGRPAVTHFRVIERFGAHSLLGVRLETGRTHQIRVHLSYRRHPIVGDRAYGGGPRPAVGAATALAEAVRKFPRQALHALRLSVSHPLSGQRVSWESSLPADMQTLLDLLREEQALARSTD